MEAFLQELGGCGRFQVLLVIVLSLSEMTISFPIMVMAFGIYNPGWICLDNVTSSTGTQNQTMMNFENQNQNQSITTYLEDEKRKWLLNSCPLYERCQNVQFNPESSTVVSEWGLICEKKWIPPLMMSIQTVGMMLGAYSSGYLGDKIGRKRTFCLVVLMSAICNLITFLSNSWQLFTVLRFLIGFTFPCILSFPFVLGSEFSFSKWTSLIASIPSFGIGAVLFSVCALLTKDWRQIHLVTTVITAVFFIPTLLAPESMRWLTVKGKKDDVIAVANKVALINGSPQPSKDVFSLLWKSSQPKTVKYSWRDLWGQKARKRTLILTPLWIDVALIYFVTTFGVKSLTGNFYTNLIIGCSIEIPIFILATYMPNLFGRKKGFLLLHVFTTTCLFCTVGVDRLMTSHQKDLATLILVMTIKGCVSTAWYILQIFTAESYPTVIRTTCLGYTTVVSRIGAIAGPYLIPNDPDTYYISYSIMAVLTFTCSLLVLLLPETKGKQLTDTWEELNKRQAEPLTQSSSTKC